MSASHAARLTDLHARMAEARIDLLVVQDPDTIAWLAGYWGYLGMEFGRATLLAVPREAAPVLITPAMEAEMARRMCWVEDLRPWQDGLDGEWPALLEAVVEAAAHGTIAIEHPAEGVLAVGRADRLVETERPALDPRDAAGP